MLLPPSEVVVNRTRSAVGAAVDERALFWETENE